MGDPIATLKPTHFHFKAGAPPQTDQIFSSSPGFGTPAINLKARADTRRGPPIAFAPQIRTESSHVILPIEIKPQVLRPVAFRNLTRKHSLTVSAAGLQVLATFIGKHCGSGWREDGLAEKVLDEVAKLWKRDGGGLILEDGSDKRLQKVLKTLEPCMLGGHIDTVSLSRSNTIGGPLSRSNSLSNQPLITREDSLGLSKLHVLELEQDDMEDVSTHNARSYIKVISAFHQPRLQYSASKKTLEVLANKPTILSPIHHRIAAFRNRYNLVHARLMRNESFQNNVFSTTASTSRSTTDATSTQAAYKLTSISALLGRNGSSHLILGLLVRSPAGDLALTDLTGSVVLDTSMARPIPDDGAWFCPGMIVLIEGVYDEDGSNNSNLGSAGGIGGQIKGRFVAGTIAGPPAERREATLGTGHEHKIDSVRTQTGAGYGWFDFLGVGSDRNAGARMRRTKRKVFERIQIPSTLADMVDDDDEPSMEDRPARPSSSDRSRILLLGSCELDRPSTLSAIRAILNACTTSPAKVSHGAQQHASQTLPLAVVFFGNFASTQLLTSPTFSIQYKASFDALALVLAEFPTLLSQVTLIFVPGKTDAWSSTFSLGASSMLPQAPVPDLFTSRIKRAVNSANTEARLKSDNVAGEVIFTSNPARVSLFGPVDELLLFRDDLSGRIKRTALTFAQGPAEEESNSQDQDPLHDMTLDLPETAHDTQVEIATSRQPKSAAPLTSRSQKTARMLTKLLVDQSHLSPFPPSIRPLMWDYSAALEMLPLPTTLCLCDAEADAFAVTYEGCHVVNVGSLVERSRVDLGSVAQRRSGSAKYVEFDVVKGRGEVREVYYNS